MELNRLEKRLKEINSDLFSRLQNTVKEVDLLLQQYSKNFLEYTDHSIKHTRLVFDYASLLLSDEDIDNLNDDEIYILSMACYLHDVGMCIPEEKIKEIENTEEILDYRKNNPDKPVSDYIRDIHHILSCKFIETEQELLGIPNESYAKAIGLVAQGHRKVDLENVDIYKPRFTVKSGRTFVCMPYLAAIIRIADELDITNIRTPRLLTKYYMPDNEFSQREWRKHIATTKVNLLEDDDTIRYEVVCTTQDMYAALKEQFQKVSDALMYGLKVIKNISNTGRREFSLDYNKIDVKYDFKDFDPKGIKFSFDTNNVVKTFIGENLYENKLVAIREALQNSIDTCRYKRVLKSGNFEPNVNITILKNKIVIEDNGLGMDEFIIKNYFSKMASSFYQQESIAKEYESIGQFGIGVFSYFLIADFIDIETKTDKSKTLKFRIDEDPNAYFHFFEKTNRKKAGTTITLHIKDNIKIKPEEIYKFIRETFRFIEFPINFVSGDETTEIKKLSFGIDEEEFIKKGIKPQYSSELERIKYYTFKFDNKDYEGSMTLFYLREEITGLGAIYDFTEIAGNERFDNLIDISQKGVLVTKTEFYDFLDNTVASINLKNKINISISRTDFSEKSHLQKITKEIYKDFTFSFFKNIVLKDYDKSSLPKLSDNYFNYTNQVFDNLYYLLVSFKGKKKILTLKKFLNLNVNFFIGNSANNSNNYDEILNINQGLYNEIRYVEKLEYLFKETHVFRYQLDGEKVQVNALIDSDKRKHIESVRDFFKSIFPYISYSFINLDSSEILDTDFYEYGRSHYFNINHPLIVDIVANKKLFDNHSAKKILINLFDEIDYAHFNIEKSIQNANFLIKLLKKETGIYHTFSKKDFALKER